MLKTKSISLLLLLALVLTASCQRFDGEQTAPAYLTIQDITVEDDADNSLNQPSGFFSSKIDCVWLVAYFAGDTAETTLGVFELPCRVPVLRQGTITKLTAYPVIKQNGVAATHIWYPYYNSIVLKDVPIAIDSTTSLGSLTTTYGIKNDNVVWSECFEPGAQALALDSIVKKIDYRNAGYLDTVRSDAGCGVIRVTDSMTQKSFWSTDTIDLSAYSSSSYLYLELDYWTDVSFSIGFNNPTATGGTDVTKSAMVLTPNKGWDKVYVNLGRLWSKYNSYPYLRLYFSILNDEGGTGNIFLDNMKVVVM